MTRKFLNRPKPFFYLRLCLSGAVLIYLIHLINLDRLVSVIAKLQIKYAWQAFFLVIIANLVMAGRWSLLLRRFDIMQRVRDSWRYYMVGGFYSIVLPGMIGEDAVRLGQSLNAHGGSKALLATSILFERTCGIVVILMMASAAAMLLPMFMEGERHLVNLIVGVALGVLLLFFLVFFILKNAPSAWFEKEPSTSKFRQQIIALLDQIRGISFGYLSCFLLLSALAHLCDITGTFFLSRALGMDQSFSLFLLIMPLVYVITILPISIGGIGIREGVLAFLLAKVGVLASDAVLLGLIIYLNRVFVGLLGGILQFMDHRADSCQAYTVCPKCK